MNIHTSHMKGQCPFALQATAKNFDFFDPAYQQDPAQSLQIFREQLPIFYSEKMGYWVITRYEDVKAIFRDPITFSACNALEKLTPPCPEALNILEKYNYGMNRTLVNEDEPIHMERRRALLDAFAPEQLEQHRLYVKALVKERVDAFIDKQKVDLVQEMFWEVPLLVALHFLGIPEDDIEELKKFAVAHTVNTWGRPSAEEQLHVAEGVGQFWQYSGQILEKMKHNPEGKGWMYDMIAKNHVMPEVVTDNYLHSMMMAIMVAAHETTALASANAVKLLLTQRHLWKKICENPQLIPAAVEECLRYAGSVVSWRRQVTQDIEFQGVSLKKGDKLFLVSASANHDSSYFENADEVDLYRDNAIEHLTFGYGAHQCMGRNIGRMEMCIFIEELSRRIPDLQLSEQEFSYLPNTSFRGPQALWVEWENIPESTRVETNFRIGPPDTQNITRTVEVQQLIRENHDCLSIELRGLHQESLPNWTAGAHIELMLAPGLSRKYSLCGDVNAPYYRIVVKREPESRGGSLWIHDHLKLGDQLQIKGPKNFFKLDLNAEKHILIAGGIGITPILAMANTLKAHNKPYRLLYLAREREHMALIDEVIQQHKEALELYISSQQKLDLDYLLQHAEPQTQICACGPERLLDALSHLSTLYPQLNVTIEHFNAGSTALILPDDQSFDVELVDSGVTFTVPKDKTLLECLIERGVDVSYDCQEGLCGSCQVVVEEGEIDHRDKVLTQAERQCMNSMMSCCSRGKGKTKIKL